MNKSTGTRFSFWPDHQLYLIQNWPFVSNLDFYPVLGIFFKYEVPFWSNQALVVNGTAYAIEDIMETERFVSLKEMKEALINEVGKPSPVKITRNNGEATVLYIRGFADQQTNILLFSDSFGSVGLKIMEVKDIRSVEYPEANQMPGSIRVLNAKWNKKLLILLTPFFLL